MFSIMPKSLPPMNPGPEGYDILPPGKHQCSFKEFYKTFVTGHSGDTQRRRKIIEDFLWVYRRQASIGLSVSSYWFDGSFVSGKPYPSDIDFVSHIDGATSNPVEDPHPWLNSGDTFQHTVAPGADRKLLVDVFALVKLPDDAPRACLVKIWGGVWDR